jgi:hypothetical protein
VHTAPATACCLALIVGVVGRYERSKIAASCAYRSDVRASTASDVNSKAALRQTIAVSFASAGRPRTGIFGSKRLSSVGLLAGTIGKSGLMSAL